MKKSCDIVFNSDDFEIIKKIDSGAFGEVILVKNKNGNLFAIKNIFDITKDNFQLNFFREIEILKNLDYPSLMKFYGVNLQDSDDKNKIKPSILMEYYPNGSLARTIQKCIDGTPEYFTPTCKYKALLGISYGMRYLHENNIIHRDLKPLNILFDSNYEICICDFGLSRYLLTSSSQKEMTKSIGTVSYMAPEVFNDSETYDEKVDVYSFGMIAYEIITGKKLYENMNIYHILNKVDQGFRPNLELDSISNKMKSLIRRCWSRNARERPSFGDICDLLSNDFSYFKEEVNKKEIEKYIAKLQAKKNEDKYLEFCNILISNTENFIEKRIDILYFNFFKWKKLFAHSMRNWMP